MPDTPNLDSKRWTTNGLEFVGESGVENNVKPVTNRTDIGSSEFIRLQVEKTN